MKTKIRSRGSLVALALLAMATVAPSLAVAQAQETVENRLKRVETELRAVQRKVFPDGAGKTFAPEITAATTPAPAAVGTPAAGAVTDLLSRMDAVEQQLQRLTAQTEENQNRMGKLEARLTALEPAPAPSPAPEAAASTPATPAGAVTLPPVTTKPAAKPAATPAPAATPTQATPSADRVAAVRAIEKPKSNDAGEDEYLYGYRLWEAKFYPEAAQQLQKVVDQYPRHKRISYARNLLGRAWLDDGKPGTAAQFFLQNYLADKKGDRASDSLLYLGVAMTRIKDTKRACGAFQEFRATYPQDVEGRLKTQYEAATRGVKCD
ncbi:tol-pal system YbgF family protein [Novosphingobium sp. NBM11]|uniref:tetratricopeptide repeat protein n=1 Tax=Novosphingobium sp. NBM11 TaxID=2596914 RepID=UPI002107BE51|nr:tetratricopeptide repeat protein [Novosphingobium sp. NBM11]